LVKRKNEVLLMLLLLTFTLYVFRDHVNVQAASLGDIIITEIMVDPKSVPDYLGEWFEVYNPTDTAINMKNWVIMDDGADFHTISKDLYVQPGDFAVLGINADELTNGGVTCDYQYSSFRIVNFGGDEIVLGFGGAPIDRVSYPGWAVLEGRSLQLHPDAFDRNWNDLLENWCASTTLMSSGDYGTPCEFNVECDFPPTPPPTPMIESCNSTGAGQDVFELGETVFATGSEFAQHDMYPFYLVENLEVWTDGMTIPERIPGTEQSITSNENGEINPTDIWHNPQTLGGFDMIVDVNSNGYYDEGVDALDDSDIEMVAGFVIIPELIAILPAFILATLTAFIFLRRKVA
jgi:hypothetical protein